MFLLRQQFEIGWIFASIIKRFYIVRICVVIFSGKRLRTQTFQLHINIHEEPDLSCIWSSLKFPYLFWLFLILYLYVNSTQNIINIFGECILRKSMSPVPLPCLKSCENVQLVGAFVMFSQIMCTWPRENFVKV